MACSCPVVGVVPRLHTSGFLFFLVLVKAEELFARADSSEQGFKGRFRRTVYCETATFAGIRVKRYRARSGTPHSGARGGEVQSLQ